MNQKLYLKIHLFNFPKMKLLALSFSVQCLKNRKKFSKAYALLKPISNTDKLDKKQLQLYYEIQSMVMQLKTLEGRTLGEDEDFSILSLKHALLSFKNRVIKKTPASTLGKTLLNNRWLRSWRGRKTISSNCHGTHTGKIANKKIAGTRLQEVEVLVNSLDSEKKSDFFLPFLQEHGRSQFFK